MSLYIPPRIISSFDMTVEMPRFPVEQLGRRDVLRTVRGPERATASLVLPYEAFADNQELFSDIVNGGHEVHVLQCRNFSQRGTSYQQDFVFDRISGHIARMEMSAQGFNDDYVSMDIHGIAHRLSYFENPILALTEFHIGEDIISPFACDNIHGIAPGMVFEIWAEGTLAGWLHNHSVDQWVVFDSAIFKVMGYAESRQAVDAYSLLTRNGQEPDLVVRAFMRLQEPQCSLDSFLACAMDANLPSKKIDYFVNKKIEECAGRLLEKMQTKAIPDVKPRKLRAMSLKD